jgi:hypothetical protein
MNWKYLPIVFLAGTIVALSTLETPACGLRHSSCCSVATDCCAPPPCAPVAPPAPVKMKVMVTEYKREEYDATRTVMKLMSKEEKFMAEKCEWVPVEKKVMVTRNICTPKTKEVEVKRWVCQPVTKEVEVVRCAAKQFEEEREVIRCELVRTEEEREVTRWICKRIPVTTTVTRMVDVGGTYECRPVACGNYSSGSGHRCGLFRRHGGGCGDCGPSCGEVVMTTVYVPKLEAKEFKVESFETKMEQLTEKIKFLVCRPVEKKEKVKVVVWKPVEWKEKVMVTTSQMIEKTEKVMVTYNEMTAETKEETIKVLEMKRTPVEMTRTVCFWAPVEEKYKACKLTPVTVEKEILVYPTGCGSDYGGYSDSPRHGLFRR